MIQDVEVPGQASIEDDPALRLAGGSAKGEFHCAECGYGVTVYRTLPSCPMCAGEVWEQSAWSPFARSRVGEEL